jgi:hypothetical protein
VRFASFPSFFFPGLTSSSRRSRIHCFENVNVLIFLVAISEYDQTLYEDSDINRMNEAAGLFESISNSRWFAQSSVILFMNKTDLFKGTLVLLPFLVSRSRSDFVPGGLLSSQPSSLPRPFTSTTRTTRARATTRPAARTWRASSALFTATRSLDRSSFTLPALRTPFCSPLPPSPYPADTFLILQ